MPSSTVEDYLKAIYLASEREAGGRVATGTLAQRLGVSPGTVTSMLKTLAGSGLADYEPYAGVELTPQGRHLAAMVLRRHRLLEQFLVEVLGMHWGEVHEEAEVLEHVVSDRLLEHLDRLLGHPERDPHGDPIPDARGEVPAVPGVALSEAPAGVPLIVRRVLDQRQPFLDLLSAQGVTPGAAVTVLSRDDLADTVELRTGTGRVWQLSTRAASKVLVASPEREPAGETRSSEADQRRRS